MDHPILLISETVWRTIRKIKQFVHRSLSTLNLCCADGKPFSAGAVLPHAGGLPGKSWPLHFPQRSFSVAHPPFLGTILEAPLQDARLSLSMGEAATALLQETCRWEESLSADKFCLAQNYLSSKS